MTNEIDTLVAQYLATHPDFVYPQAGDRHPCILAIGDQMQPWLIAAMGGAYPYWRAMLDSARGWFADEGAEHSREFRLFCYFFEAAGNIAGAGVPQQDDLNREYRDWRRSKNQKFAADADEPVAATNRPAPVSRADVDVARSMLDQLLTDSRLYRRGSDYKNLLDFLVRLRNFAPFNALLLQIQKPGLNHAASARDWRETFSRTVNVGARPLLILWPFGPVALVYDLMDTHGDPIPDGVMAFAATGIIDQAALLRYERCLSRKNIAWTKLDAGDRNAGSIELVKRAAKTSDWSSYKMGVNKNHDPNVQFSTLTHELAHLFLGHLGRDGYLRIPGRPALTHRQRELEAECTAFIVCGRNGVECKSQSYLAGFVAQDTTTEQLDLYQIVRAAGQVEAILGLAAHTKVDRPVTRHNKAASLFSETSPEPTDLFDTGN